METFPDGMAIVYCEGAFGTPNGKTAHGLVRRTKRYQVLSIIDSKHTADDAGQILDGKPKGIPVVSDLQTALKASCQAGRAASHFVIGLAPDGGRLSSDDRQAVIEAIKEGLHVDSGLHDFLSEDEEIASLAEEKKVRIRDVRKTPPRKDLHFFSGKIEQVTSLKVAVLGTDSAVGKRTTAWLIIDAFQEAGYGAELVGTGQTSWMQGAKYCIMLDSLINDFVSGEIEHAVWAVWKEENPDAVIIEGQGSLMNPAYPGGFEILAAGRPDAAILQHAPARKEYDGFSGYPIQPLPIQIKAIEIISGKPVAAVTINHEHISKEEIPAVCDSITRETGLPAVDVLLEGAGRLVPLLLEYKRQR